MLGHGVLERRCLRRSNGIIYNPSPKGVYNDDVAGAWPVPDLWQQKHNNNPRFLTFLLMLNMLKIFHH